MNSTNARTERVWHRLHEELLRFLQRRVDDPALADDLLQEVFSRIVEKLPTLEDANNLRAWVYRIARNVLVDHFRRRAPASEADDIDESSPPEEANHNVEVAGWLSEMVEHLPETYREAVRLSELEGASQKEVADRLGLSHSGAKSRVQRGRSLLREALLDCCHLEFDTRGNVIDVTRRGQDSGCSACCDEASSGEATC